MWGRIGAHLRSQVVAYVALFVALSGTAIAAGLPPGSVGTRQLKNRAVTGQKVARRTLTGANIAPLHWLNAATMNGWTLYSAGYAPAGYAKDASGVVHLRGGIRGGSGPAFILPPGYRPAHFLYMPIYTNGGTEGSVLIYPSGKVYPFGSEATNYSGLDGISFPAGE